MSFRFDRAYYRLVYPVSLRPTFQLGDRSFPVIDLSEQGARLLVETSDEMPAGAEVRGAVRLPTGESIEVEGTVIRLEVPHACMALKKGIPFGTMLDQQRFLQRRVIAWR